LCELEDRFLDEAAGLGYTPQEVVEHLRSRLEKEK
jgi:hypothetical protein